jgi:hypothetical protein
MMEGAVLFLSAAYLTVRIGLSMMRMFLGDLD